MIRAEVDSREFQRALKVYAKAVDLDGSEAVKEMARTGARQLAMRTEPYGLNGKAKNVAEMAISKDVSLAYATNARTYAELKKVSPRKANAYAAALNAGDLAAADKIVRSVAGFEGAKPDDTGSALESLRNSRGRVSGPSRTNLTSEGATRAIRAEKLRTAGTAKAGWVQAGEAIQSKSRFPAWLRKSASLGSARVLKSGWRTVVFLVNRVRYTSNVLPSGKLQAALAATKRNHLSRIKRIMAARASKV